MAVTSCDDGESADEIMAMTTSNAVAIERPTLAPIGLRLVHSRTRPIGKQKKSPIAIAHQAWYQGSGELFDAVDAIAVALVGAIHAAADADPAGPAAGAVGADIGGANGAGFGGCGGNGGGALTAGGTTGATGGGNGAVGGA